MANFVQVHSFKYSRAIGVRHKHCRDVAGLVCAFQNRVRSGQDWWLGGVHSDFWPFRTPKKFILPDLNRDKRICLVSRKKDHNTPIRLGASRSPGTSCFSLCLWLCVCMHDFVRVTHLSTYNINWKLLYSIWTSFLSTWTEKDARRLWHHSFSRFGSSMSGV